MDCSTPGFSAHHQLPKLAQTHVHGFSDGIQPSHPLSSHSPAFNLSQHQGLFQWVSYSHQVAKVLELQLQHQSFQWMFRTDTAQDQMILIVILLFVTSMEYLGHPRRLSGKEFSCQCKRHRFNPWVRKVLWRRKWQPTSWKFPCIDTNNHRYTNSEYPSFLKTQSPCTCVSQWHDLP